MSIDREAGRHLLRKLRSTNQPCGVNFRRFAAVLLRLRRDSARCLTFGRFTFFYPTCVRIDDFVVTHVSGTNPAQQAAVAQPLLANDLFLRLARSKLRRSRFCSEKTTFSYAPFCGKEIDRQIASNWCSRFHRSRSYQFERYPTVELFIAGIYHSN